MTPMSGSLYPNAVAAPYGPGGFDPRTAYAAPAWVPHGHTSQAYAPMDPQSHSAQAPYDPFALVGGGAIPYNSGHQSSYTSSASSSSRIPARGSLSAVSTAEYSDSISDLKRRQQQMVNSYEQGISNGQVHAQAPIQHLDSAVRTLDPPGLAPVELPPVYTPV
jgi:hypothetical protein